jgi:hypothetical protein
MLQALRHDDEHFRHFRGLAGSSMQHELQQNDG